MFRPFRSLSTDWGFIDGWLVKFLDSHYVDDCLAYAQELKGARTQRNRYVSQICHDFNHICSLSDLVSRRRNLRRGPKVQGPHEGGPVSAPSIPSSAPVLPLPSRRPSCSTIQIAPFLQVHKRLFLVLMNNYSSI